MSSFLIKIIGIITMFIDHWGYQIFNDISWMNYIGRIAFPIFAWQIAVGCDKTKNAKMYMLRLFILALISQPLYMVLFNPTVLNTVFTLLLGVIGICIYKKNHILGYIFMAIGATLAQIFNFDYGAYGFFMVIIFSLLRENNWITFVVTLLVNFIFIGLKLMLPIQFFSMIGILITMLYNNKKGPGLKYLFYAFYPVHLLILFLTYKL